MTLTRRTFWSNGLVTDRSMSFAMEDMHEFIEGQQRRANNGPGIHFVVLLDGRQRAYKTITPVVKP